MISSLQILYCWTQNGYGIEKAGNTYRKRGVRKSYLQCPALGEKNHYTKLDIQSPPFSDACAADVLGKRLMEH